MFHRYVLACGRPVDFDRASYLMDKDLLDQAYDQMRNEMFREPRWDATYDHQYIWDVYCSLHRKRYGAPFQPNVDPDWDR